MNKKKIALIGCILLTVSFFIIWFAYLKEYYAYMIVIEDPNIEKCNDYMNRYKKGRYLTEITDLKDDLLYENVMNANFDDNCLQYEMYLTPFRKSGKHFKEVLKLQETCFYNSAVSSRDLREIDDFLVSYPGSDFTDKLLRMKDDINDSLLSLYAVTSSKNRGKADAVRFFKQLLTYMLTNGQRNVEVIFKEQISLKDWKDYDASSRQYCDRIYSNPPRDIVGMVKPSEHPPVSLKSNFDEGDISSLEDIIVSEIQNRVDGVFGDRLIKIEKSTNISEAKPFVEVEYSIMNSDHKYGSLLIPDLYFHYTVNSFRLFEGEKRFEGYLLGIKIDFRFVFKIPFSKNAYKFVESVKPAEEIKDIGGISDGYRKMTRTVFENFIETISGNFGL